MTAAASLAAATACASAGSARPQPFPQPGRSAEKTVAKPALIAGPPATTATPAPSPNAVPPAIASRAQDVLDRARALLGIPYQLGGDGPATGFDCSGFVRYVFEEARHLDLPRTVAEQFDRGTRVAIQDVRAGDLLFFSTTGPGPTHVGIAIGGGEFIHAPTSNGVVRIEHYDTPYWHDRLVGARRLLP